MALVMSNLNALKHIERGLRTAPRVLTLSGVLVVQILDDSVINWCESLRSIINLIEEDAPQQADVSLCPQCKHNLTRSGLFCMFCGYKRQSATTDTDHL